MASASMADIGVSYSRCNCHARKRKGVNYPGPIRSRPDNCTGNGACAKTRHGEFTNRFHELFLEQVSHGNVRTRSKMAPPANESKRWRVGGRKNQATQRDVC